MITEEEIILKYPELFGTPPFDPKETLICFGLETPETWYPILDKLFSEISKIIKEQNITFFRICQVKEKFGELRIYADGETPEIEKLIEEAEKEVSTVCSYCGSNEAVNKCIKGWYQTICPSCEEKKQTLIIH